MALREDLDGVSRALARFKQELESTTRSLPGLGGGGGGSAGLGGAGLGSGGGGGSSLGLALGAGRGGALGALGGAAGIAGGALGVANAVAPFAEVAANNFGAAGAGSAVGGVLRTGGELLQSAGPIGSFLSEITGVSDALDVRGRTASRVKGVTTELARAGVEVDDELRQKLIDRTLSEEKRVQQESERVDAELDKPENLGKASESGTLFGILNEMLSLLRQNNGGGAAGVPR